MQHNEIWSDWFDPPFATHGEAIVGWVLALSVVFAGALLGGLQVDALLMAGRGGFAAIVGGALLGLIVGLVVLAVASRLGRGSGNGMRRQRIAAGVIGVVAVVASLWILVPLLRAEPALYLEGVAPSYERTYSRGGREVRRETVSGAQVSAEAWVRDAGLAAGAVAALALLAFVPVLSSLPPVGQLRSR